MQQQLEHTLGTRALRHGAVRRFLAGLAAALMAGAAWAADAVNVDVFGVALKGHDPVAYFTDGGPQKGRPELRASHGGAVYWFASEANRQRFEAEPAKYVPQYGGFCAYGVAQGYKPDIDPTAFRIVDGRLYLNLSPAVQQRWQQDIPGFITQADQNWSRLRKP